MRYQVEITREALHTLAKLDKPTRRRIQAKIESLRDDPRPHGALALHGLRSAFRIRVGDYRVINTVEDGRLVVVAVDIGHRREVYRGL